MPLVGLIDRNGRKRTFSEIEEGYRFEDWGLPLTILRWSFREREPYCDHSTTQLTDHPRRRWLRERHDYFLDPLSRIWMLFGTGLHRALEKEADPGQAEVQLVHEVALDTERRFRVGGTIDYVPDAIWDYKGMKTYKAQKIQKAGLRAEAFEFVAQVSIYRWLMAIVRRKTIEKGYICGLVRDVPSLGARKRWKEQWYPEDVQVWEVPMLTIPETTVYVEQRIILHEEARNLPDDQLPECPEEDLWLDAKTGEPKRCVAFCEAAKTGKCSQFNAWKEQQG